MNIIKKIKDFFTRKEWIEVDNLALYKQIDETDYAYQIRIYMVDKLKNPKTNDVRYSVDISWEKWVWKDSPMLADQVKENDPLTVMYDDANVYPEDGELF